MITIRDEGAARIVESLIKGLMEIQPDHPAIVGLQLALDNYRNQEALAKSEH